MKLCNVGSAMSYDGDWLSIALNYSNLLICTISMALVLRNAEQVSANYPTLARNFYIPFIIIMVFLQILGDCLMGDAGVSAIWAAQAGFLSVGYLVLNEHFDNFLAKASFYVSIVCSLSLLAYFAINDLALTTIAHLWAFSFGGLCASLHRRFFGIAQSYEAVLQ
mmetsp:Transcript_8811/g.12388  ORF Transcript_8811/g.12388 Transcript_8811/m.12388 type:complete len:165 (+) Transcript_8811:36-530(+)